MAPAVQTVKIRRPGTHLESRPCCSGVTVGGHAGGPCCCPGLLWSSPCLATPCLLRPARWGAAVPGQPFLSERQTSESWGYGLHAPHVWTHRVGRGPASLSLPSQAVLSCAVGPAVKAEFCHSASSGRTLGAQPLQQLLSLSREASLRERLAGVLVSNSTSQQWPSNWGIMNSGRHPRFAKMPSSFPTTGGGGASLWPLPGFNWEVIDAP